MNQARNGSRARLGALLAVALGAAALLAIPAISAADPGGHDRGHSYGRGHNNGEHRHHPAGPPASTTTGTISSFETATGHLTITLPSGETVSGTVDAATRIRCQNQQYFGRHHVRGASSDSGSSSPGGPPNGRGPECTTAALVAGTVVRQAELVLQQGVATFGEVDLAD